MNKKEMLFKLISMLMVYDEKNACESSGKEKRLIGEKVIVRCRDAGVHFGELVDYEGCEVVLKDSRRMYYWKAAKGHTLSGCALHGITDESKISGKLQKDHILPEACEIIPCSDIAAASIGGSDEYNN